MYNISFIAYSRFIRSFDLFVSTVQLIFPVDLSPLFKTT